MSTWAIDWLAVIFVLAVVFGAMVHWWRQYIWDPVNTGGFVHYWIGGSSVDRSASGCTLLVLIGAILMALANGVQNQLSPYLMINAAIVMGFGIDAFFNKGMPPASTTGADVDAFSAAIATSVRDEIAAQKQPGGILAPP